MITSRMFRPGRILFVAILHIDDSSSNDIIDLLRAAFPACREGQATLRHIMARYKIITLRVQGVNAD